MEIIHRGKLPGTRRYKSTCSNCKTVFSFLHCEARLSTDPRDGNCLIVMCPLVGCSKEAWVLESEYVGPG